ncbi:hypothetical protein [Rhodobacter sp. SY28-1]|uniref:hypothetical protein n=1 Tax=Rhodobacter sp. SY28-1 TaxID=2562317 RepID=UPI0010C0D0EF|nr:hypothetical protein [Rhodobacter sp. SY28-1]
MRSLVLIALLAAPAQAEVPRISLIFGPDALNAAPEDIRSVRRIDEGDRGAALVIRLSGSFDRLMSDLTAAHVGETGKLLICNELAVEPYLNAPINEAMFVISDTDIARLDRLQALLTGPRCAEVPDS